MRPVEHMLRRAFVYLFFVGLLLGATVGCGLGPAGDAVEHKTEPLGKKLEPLVWTATDNPDRFSTGLEKEFSKLPTQGTPTHAAWAGGYWPTYQDSINYRWDGAQSDSPTVKYEKAFGATGLEQKISDAYGVQSYKTKGKACTLDSECDPGQLCGKRHGETNGFCIHSWVGICHGWAPAAAMEPEPQKTVTHNGVTFKINDLKALLSLFYTEVSYKFMSLRCNANDEAGEIEYDVYGRPTGAFKQCQDTNAGTFHVILANYLGIKKQPIVEDRIADVQVWNHPVTAYRVTYQKDITAQVANELVASRFGGSVAKDKWQHHTAFAVKAGDKVKIEMTGDGDADLHVRFGQQATDKDYDCRPYENGSAEICDITVPAGATQMFVSVLGYEKHSTYELDIKLPTAQPSSYRFNSGAAKLVHIKLDVEYITESSATVDGNLSSRIRDFTYTDKYEYILELDASGKITGGEWIGSSKRNHPDFLWLPERLQQKDLLNGALSYTKVRMLLDQSVQAPPSNIPTDETWNGNGSIISFSSGTATGFGLTHDVSRIHPTSPNAPVVYFQWEVDARDGKRLEISAPGMTTATITYGSWSTRAKDRTYRNVALPFVLDPQKDGFAATDGNWYVVKVAFAQKPAAMITVQAKATNGAASTATSIAATGDGALSGTHSWNGNGSLISYSSGTATGYGLTYDVSQIHPYSTEKPAVFFQWEIDARDGRKVTISAPGMTTATISYGSWATRAQDKVHANVALPFVVDPQKDGFSTTDGSWYVIKVAFANKPTTSVTVKAETTK